MERNRAIRVAASGKIISDGVTVLQVTGVILTGTADCSAIFYSADAATSGTEKLTLRALAKTTASFGCGDDTLFRLASGGYVALSGAGAEVTVLIR